MICINEPHCERRAKSKCQPEMCEDYVLPLSQKAARSTDELKLIEAGGGP